MADSPDMCLFTCNVILIMNVFTFNCDVVPIFAVENENHCDFVKLREMLVR